VGFKRIFEERKVTAEEAVNHIKSNDCVVLGLACGEPTVLVNAMCDNKEQYENVTLLQMFTPSPAPYAQPGMEKHFRYNTYFCGPNTRDAINCNRGDFIPMNQSDVPTQFRDGSRKVDVALIQVSPPDKHGFCSYGVSVDYTKPAAEAAKIVIAEVNKQCPRTLGDSFIHVSEIDYIVESDREVISFPLAKIDEIDLKIGEYTASLIEDGSTIQIGVGAIPDAVVLSLKDKKDLGVHSELLTDSMVELYKAGVINGSRKTINKGKMVATLLCGTKNLYDFVDNNPDLEMHPTDYVNHPIVIAKNYRMVSVNACIQCDLMGQTGSEMIGKKQFSGTGGQNDFVRGASWAPEGKSILVFRSTTRDEKISKIVPMLDEGAALTNLRNDAGYVVTEYGIAELKNKTLKERAKALIYIAHPNFRDELKLEYEKRFSCSF
jgi:4-hydroxybutyrate CoA-transferase